MFRTHRVGKTLILSLTGQLSGRGTDWLDHLSMARPLPPRVIVDLGAVTGVNRKGAEALVDAYIATTLRAGCLALTRPTVLVSRQLEYFGVSRLVPTLRRAVAGSTAGGW
jgi:anti-anti-sigma regulatory factor